MVCTQGVQSGTGPAPPARRGGQRVESYKISIYFFWPFSLGTLKISTGFPDFTNLFIYIFQMCRIFMIFFFEY